MREARTYNNGGPPYSKGARAYNNGTTCTSQEARAYRTFLAKVLFSYYSFTALFTALRITASCLDLGAVTIESTALYTIR